MKNNGETLQQKNKRMAFEWKKNSDKKKRTYFSRFNESKALPMPHFLF